MAVTAQWDEAAVRGSYEAGIARESFIRCSARAQLAATADRYFRGRNDLVLLEVDVPLLSAELRHQASGGGLFPHIYGPIALQDVAAVQELRPGDDERLRLPGTLDD